MEKYNNWKRKFYAIWAGQAVSLITSAILQMAIIFYLTEKTGSAMVLSMASLLGFLPYAVFGPAIGVLVDRHDRKKIMIGADLIIAAAGSVLTERLAADTKENIDNQLLTEVSSRVIGNLRRRADGRNDVETSMLEESLERRFRLAALRSERGELYHLRATRQISNETLQKLLHDRKIKNII